MVEPTDVRIYGIAMKLRIDSATAEIFCAFTEAGIRAVVLKGPSIASWLYSETDQRFYVDSDFLVHPDDLKRAEAVLAELGFAKRFDDSRMPDWWREHATDWFRQSDGVLVDLHRVVPGVRRDPIEAWEILTNPIATVAVGHGAVAALPLPARTLQVVLHAAHHGSAWDRPLEDLQRAVVQVEKSVWQRAAALANQLEAAGPFVSGLRLMPEGSALADRLGLQDVVSVDDVLKAGTPPPVALGLQQLADAPGLRARAVIIGRKLVPPAEFVRHWQPDGTDTRRGLASAYLRRPFWILRHTPEALRAWVRARRAVRRSSSGRRG